MSYLVTARKYRPQLFEELVGQEHVTITLKNAITRGKIGHAYLFSGSRGVGKTSAARIFAKALNCEHGPTPTPCNKCVYCREITEGRSLDLVEIDGASNRGINEIRQLRENVKFVPSSARYKIYIIDEVHMLTTEAFNALLKTLEEPPEHVVFIFATTELHKVPATIRSRCQQFVFKSIPTPLIVDTLKRIIEDIGIEADEKALFWIAKNATGSMRDAESMLDQLISYSEGRITLNDVFEVLGLPKYELYHRIVESIYNENYRACFKVLDDMLRDGVGIETIISGLIEYFRNLYLLLLGEKSEDFIDLPNEDIAIMKRYTDKFTSRDINNLLLILTKLYLDSRGSEIARHLLEITFIKMVHYREIIHPSEILARLEALEKRLDGVKTESSDSNSVKGREVLGEKTKLYQKKVVESANNSVSGAKEVTREAIIDKAKGNTAEENIGIGNIEVGNEDNFLNAIIKSLIFKRRAIAEFLQRASRYTFNKNTLKIYFDKSQKLGYEHLNNENVKKQLRKEIEKIIGQNIILEFYIEDGGGAKETEEKIISPDVEKVLQIFKGEIISNNNANGGN